jgi:AraC-like DNA-binding protein
MRRESERDLDASWNAVAASPLSLAADELLYQGPSLLAARYFGCGRIVRYGRRDSVIKQIRDYLHDHVEDAVTVSELSAIVSMSRFRLTRLFQKAYGMPVASLLSASAARRSEAATWTRSRDRRGCTRPELRRSKPSTSAVQADVWNHSRPMASRTRIQDGSIRFSGPFPRFLCRRMAECERRLVSEVGR